MPGSLGEALEALDADPTLTVLAGGTDLLVELNYGRLRPDGVLGLRRVPELRGWRLDGDDLVLGAATTYAELLEPTLARLAPALAQAARTVGSPQIRNTGTIGGNLATASPAGDTLPVLWALDATVEVASRSGSRTLPVAELVVGPKQNTLAPGELIVAVRLPVARGPQEFLKVGVRNAMVIAIASCALVVDVPHRAVGCALGSVGPVPIRDHASERWLADRIDWDALRAPHGTDGDGSGSPGARAAPLPEPARAAFARRIADASRPIDDHRSPAVYRRHAVEVLARRALDRVAGRTGWDEPDAATGPGAAGLAAPAGTTVSGPPPDAEGSPTTEMDGAGRPRAVPAARGAGQAAADGVYELSVNGERRLMGDAWVSESLLRVLRDPLGLPGSKNACEQGECGSCSVLVDGVLVCACLELASAAAGCEITTVEGLSSPGTPPGAEPGDTLLGDVQRAMVDEGGVQCGFCTPGLVVAIDDLLDRVPAPSTLEVREALAGNLCRCTGYGRILAAVEQVIIDRSLAGAGAPPARGGAAGDDDRGDAAGASAR